MPQNEGAMLPNGALRGKLRLAQATKWLLAANFGGSGRDAANAAK